MRDLLLWVPDWLASRLMDAAALVSRRVWRDKRYIDMDGNAYQGTLDIGQALVFRLLIAARVRYGNIDGGPCVQWDGWQPGRYV